MHRNGYRSQLPPLTASKKRQNAAVAIVPTHQAATHTLEPSQRQISSRRTIGSWNHQQESGVSVPVLQTITVSITQQSGDNLGYATAATDNIVISINQNNRSVSFNQTLATPDIVAISDSPARLATGNETPQQLEDGLHQTCWCTRCFRYMLANMTRYPNELSGFMVRCIRRGTVRCELCSSASRGRKCYEVRNIDIYLFRFKYEY